MEKVIHRELCKELNCDHTTKRHMQIPKSVFESEIYKIYWDFEIQKITKSKPENQTRW